MSIIIGNMKSLNLKYDELWFIMRSMDWFYKKKIGNRYPKYSNEINQKNYQLLMQPNVKIVDDLAPSRDLFTWYMRTKQQGNWNMDTFTNGYVPTFIKDIFANQDAKDRLNQLWRLDKQGKTILLVCSCQEEAMCHRSIIAGLLHGVGCNVSSSMNNDISQYDVYRTMYCEIENKNK